MRLLRRLFTNYQLLVPPLLAMTNKQQGKGDYWIAASLRSLIIIPPLPSLAYVRVPSPARGEGTTPAPRSISVIARSLRDAAIFRLVCTTHIVDCRAALSCARKDRP